MFAARQALNRGTSLVSQRLSSVPSHQRNFATKAAVAGAAGGIGQSLSLLMKLDPNIDELALLDVAPVVPGVAVDISHVNSHCQVTGGFNDNDAALKDCNIVVVPAGVPRKPGMTRDDLFNINASINAGLAAACAKNCPDAMMLIISNPVNSMVPIWAEVLKKHGVYNPKRLMGVTTLDVTRANTFVAQKLGKDVGSMKVDVIGGHAGTTILPLLSQVPGISALSQADLEALTYRIQFGGDEVVKAKDGAGSATLSMAYAGAEFAAYVARALKGEQGLKACTYVENNITDAAYFSTPVTLSKEGVAEVHGYGDLSAMEKANFDAMMPDLKGQIAKGVDFVANMK
mmetsp:Transcript_1317/g.2939  ORF Transcript_1317/g.2939 Transcript_1317/m.2939 type:complete len:344 (+) Transcript_1317:229-1260(+)|eukprot:CAMPEP_0178992014 /NCGR_PEP_ID=MMETSP0795-20121207/5865_1 /TAXON_ID=88552 /ORGANISM="Amoebophrya sp., Strain Ameob2" /LENGTH=343 /DNA_ID=CAMNT_0020683821 /DNA_START=224 /DNA_END=1255 /DNA_ORIENTATION=+